ncbi:MAG: phospholipase D family protein [Acidobacteriota bacterium]|nr:phospholipase D family protein [Acidobacteriota bacterium]
MTLFRLFLALVFALAQAAAAGPAPAGEIASTVQSLQAPHPGKTGTYVLEEGEKSLLARSWLADKATRSIEIQYFIWSADNVGILATEALLRAAQRGVKVRVLVDDLLIDASPEAMLALAAHPNFEIRIYNPRHTVGTSKAKRLLNLATGFRASNQRMHDKTATFDGLVTITGGRNMADEYYDFDHTYNFRDRDVLVVGPIVADISTSFERFWNSPLAVPVGRLLESEARKLTPARIQAIYSELHAYARNPENYAPEVREATLNLTQKFTKLTQGMAWSDAAFLCDQPGKNARQFSLEGGGRTTSALMDLLRTARRRVTIQSPYLILSPKGLAFFRELVRRGVEVRISTNSLASTDNFQAFSGYQKQRKAILKAGIHVFEFKPEPAIQGDLVPRSARGKGQRPTLSLHAKTLVVDGETLFVGTFNLDPRSANLNTEVGVLIPQRETARQVEQNIERDMEPGNSWDAARDDPDSHATPSKRRTSRFWSVLPLQPIL